MTPPTSKQARKQQLGLALLAMLAMLALTDCSTRSALLHTPHRASNQPTRPPACPPAVRQSFVAGRASQNSWAGAMELRRRHVKQRMERVLVGNNARKASV